MFVEETLWIRGVLEEVLPDGGLEILDIGSSSLDFRTNVQPHIDTNIHRPLERRGYSITYADIKDDAGIDMVVDLSSEKLPDSLFAKKYDLIICCNILEHVVDRDLFLKNICGFVKEGSYVLFTVPRRYPRHNDPIDTMYRPSPEELLRFIGKYMKIGGKNEAVLTIEQKKYYSRPFGRKLDYLTLRPVWHLWRYYLGIFRWQVTCVLVRAETVYT